MPLLRKQDDSEGHADQRLQGVQGLLPHLTLR